MVTCSQTCDNEASGDEPYWKRVMREHDCFGVEMESFALFHNTRVTGKKAACLLRHDLLSVTFSVRQLAILPKSPVFRYNTGRYHSVDSWR